ncbi:MAG: DUF1614 domain-containing protein [Gammaproteobacteria bacterium]|jgi:uncharacterized membrane protein
MQSPGKFALLLFILAMAASFLYLGVFALALEKLGLSSHTAMLLFTTMLLGSGINLPLFRIDAQAPADDEPSPFAGLLPGRTMPFTGKTIIAVNLGGALIPAAFSIYLAASNRLSLVTLAFAIVIVASICYLASRPIRGIGIGMPIFVAPLASALTAILLDPSASAPLAYVCGTLGVLVGADLMHMKDFRKLGVPVASIGGAGTFDGIFLAGVIAVLLT